MKTKQKYLLISFSLVFIALFSTYLITNNNVYPSSYKNHQKSFQLQPGDIIITKGPVLFGFSTIRALLLTIKLFFKQKVQVTNLLLNHLLLTEIVLVQVKMNGLKFIVVLNLVLDYRPRIGLKKTMKTATAVILSHLI